MHSGALTSATAAAVGCLLDVHDRRLIVLSAADAAMWMKPDLPPDEAAHLLASLAVPPEAFAWHMVDKAVGNVRNQGPHLADPVLA